MVDDGRPGARAATSHRTRAPGPVVAGTALAAVLASCTAPAEALDPERRPTQYVQRVWRMEQGLPHDSVRAVLQTRDGYLWLGTYAGLARFDGVRFVVWDNRNSGLRHNEVRALAEWPAGVLWIGTTAGGLHRLIDDRLEPFEGIGDRTIEALEVVASDRLAVGTSAGLHWIEPDRSVTRAEELAGTAIRDLLWDGSDLWAATDRGLFHGGRAGFEAVDVREGRGAAHALGRTRDGRLWVGHGPLLVGFEPAEGDSGTRPSLVESEVALLEDVWGEIQAIVEDRDGSLWVGSYGGGLYRRTSRGIERMSVEHGLVDHRPWALHEDREGGLWLGTRGGIARLSDGPAISLSAAEGLFGDLARSVFEDDDATIWIGGDGGLSQVREGHVVRTFGTTDELLPLTTVLAILRDHEKRLWLGGIGGIIEMDPEAGTFGPAIGVSSGLPTDRVRSLLEDASSRVWIGTESGVAVAEGGLASGRAHVPAELADLDGEAVEFLGEDGDGRILIGLRTLGLRRWSEAGVEDLVQPDRGVIGVRSALAHRDGTLLAGTIGSGLLVRRPSGELHRLTTAEGLPDDAIWTLLPVGDRIWMSSDRGVFAVPFRAIDAVARGELERLSVEAWIGTEDGMKSRECNGGGRPAGLVSRDGRLWFPTSRGAVTIDPGAIDAPREAPGVVLENVLVDRVRTSPAAGEIVVPPGARDLELSYTGLGFHDPSRLRFRYRLLGYQDEWLDVGPRRLALFANLPPGSYRFEVQVAPGEGNWNPIGAGLPLRVEPTWSERTDARLGSVVLLVLGLWAFGRWRSSQASARERHLREQVALRTRELRGANEELERLAAHDGLTGLANHRTFVASLESEWARARRQEEPLALLLCDIDAFKAYNDTYGHRAGDSVLRDVARAISETLERRFDLVARYGGEEFAVLLPGTDPQGAASVAERIRLAVRELDEPHEASPTDSVLTISVGGAIAAPARDDSGSPGDLVEEADRALYEAKRSGRDRTRVREGALRVDSEGAALAATEGSSGAVVPAVTRPGDVIREDTSRAPELRARSSSEP